MSVVRRQRASAVSKVEKLYRLAQTGGKALKGGMKLYDAYKKAGSNPAYKKPKMTAKKSKDTPHSSSYVVNENSAGLYKGVKKTTHSKGVVIKKKKEVKVDKKFSAKVQKALEPGSVYGTCVNHFLGGHMESVSSNQNDFYSGAGASCATAWMFTQSQFLDAASQIFRAKAPNNLVAGLKFDNADNFRIGAGFTVMSCSSSYRFKNITKHVVVIKLFDCAPRRKSGYNVLQPGSAQSFTSGGATVVTPDCLQTPFWYWISSCQEDAQVGIARQGNINGTVAYPTPQTLFNEPGYSTTFSKAYKSEKTELILEPGQEQSLTIEGPSNVRVDLDKSMAQDVFQDIQMHSRCIVATIYDTPNGSLSTVGNTASYGRFGAVASSNVAYGYSVVVEREDHYKIKMPEQTGGLVSTAAAGSPFDLGQRRPRKIVNVYTSTNLGGGNVDINENNPTVQVQ